MLQPRVVGLRITTKPFALLIGLLIITPFGFAQYKDEPYIVEPTPALKLNDEELTTVLLVNNDNNRSGHGHGRYLNVKPEVGVLTSTARTFIQEGVTTEYATQVVGTTLDNGRLYAQLLKKSSRVLYDKDDGTISSGINPTGTVSTTIIGETKIHVYNPSPKKSLLQSHNDLIGDKDWQVIDDHLLGADNKQRHQNTFVRNTDFIERPHGAQLVFSTLGVNVNNVLYQQNHYDRHENMINDFGNGSFRVSSSSSSSSTSDGNGGQKLILANKVQSPIDLPTFTIKNMFAPSGFSWDGEDNESASIAEKSKLSHPKSSDYRSPKLLYNQAMKEELRSFSTVTYYGFADFTTVVGDTVIFFTPSTSAEAINPGHITSIKGEATLGGQDTVNQLHVPITVNQDIIEPTYTMQKLQTADIGLFQVAKDMRQQPSTTETATEEPDSSQTTEKLDENIDTTTMSIEINEQETDSSNLDLPTVELEPSIIDLVSKTQVVTSRTSTSEFSSSKVMLSRPSDEEIRKIYASLASAELARKASEMSTSKSVEEPTTPSETEIKGATTIFFEDDPFLLFDTSTTQQNKATVKPTALHIPTKKTTTTTTTTENPEENTTTEFVEELNETTTATVNDESSSLVTTTTNDETVTETTEPKTDDEEDSTTNTTPSADSQKTSEDNDCFSTSQVFLTQLPKTLTYLTTFFIPDETDDDKTTTSINSNVVSTFDIKETTQYHCLPIQIVPTKVTENDQQIMSTAALIDESIIERPFQENTKKDIEKLIESDDTTEDEEDVAQTTSMMIVTEKARVTEIKLNHENMLTKNKSDLQEDLQNDDVSDPSDEDEEIELIYKTLYTTYTYLTTFFHDSTTSISSRKEIVTNIITSTINPTELQNGQDVTDILSSMQNGQIEPTKTAKVDNFPITSSVGVGRPTTKFVVPPSDLSEIDGILREDKRDKVQPTVALDEKHVAKTFYTTYTYYTTIFVDGETEVMSRTEVYTNYVTGSVNPTARILNIVDDTVSDDDNAVLDISPTASYNTILRTSAIAESLDYSTLRRNVESSLQSESKAEITMVTDVHVSKSDGDRHIIENVNKQWNGLLEDQISSESNTEDILPSPTLLLQTSYTTFTYYTTMYNGTATNIVSRLETLTNVVTETLQPTHSISLEDATLPITYFTTFTYWTTLAKDGDITTISREETVSNIVTPTQVISSIKPTQTVELETPAEVITASNVARVSEENTTNDKKDSVNIIDETPTKSVEPTTFYTTYTYYTTSYAGDDTTINSRFETVTNVIAPTSTPDVKTKDSTSVAIEDINANLDNAILGLKPTLISSSNNDVILAPSIESISTPELNLVSLDVKKIVDAEGISTIFYTTRVVGSIINGTSTNVVSSTSSINIDEAKKALQIINSLTTSGDIENFNSSSRTYKTGLVRLIEGTKINNKTTTLYQSKVIGTVIEGRYAQIIESTSSFLIEKTTSPSLVGEIAPSVTTFGSVLKTALPSTVAPSSEAVDGSIADSNTTEDPQNEDGDGDDDEDAVDENGRPKSRLSFQSRKRTFTPVIRPFASRNRPQFAPKRKNIQPSSATIITRSDLTPTITATPAIKSESSRGRFSSPRKSSNSVLSSFSSPVSTNAGPRRFSRPSKSTASSSFGSSSVYSASSRNRLSSSRIQPSSAFNGIGSSSRRGGIILRSSSSQRGSFSSLYAGNSRNRIKPTSTQLLDQSTTYTTQAPPEEDENSTQNVDEPTNDDEEGEVTTESSRRSNNPLLRFRRPPTVGRSNSFQPSQRSNTPSQVSPRRNPLTQRSRSTTTSTTTTTTAKPRPRAFQRPTLQSFNRPRPANSLFPPRGLFQGNQNINQDLDEKENKKSNDDEFQESADNYEYEDDAEDNENEDQNNRNRRSSLRAHKRLKRQASEYGSRNNFRNRFRRPTTARNVILAEERVDEQTEEEEQTPIVTPRGRASSRYTGRSQKSIQLAITSSRQQIRPSKPTISSRSQFTLREKDAQITKPSSRTTTNFRRPTTNGIATRRTSTTANRQKNLRLKTYGNTVTEPYPSRSSSNSRSRPTTRGRSTTRSRGRNANDDIILPNLDGTITVTHHIPTEITIPVVNGKVTEYKNVVTAKVSTEILGPNQYNTIVGRNGNPTLVLNREETTINSNGATEITQFVLHESPTTSIIFTPTTIRGRKTSFSHIVPSTLYEVENLISTAQPQIAANAPLANILLSQLLLGNIGLGQQQNINPLLGLGTGGVPQQQQGPTTPTTEFKVRTTSYVTTVTNAMSTVIPLTFHGKEILTTIFDSSVNVITATEFLTETIVVTPTQQAGQQQVNSLLLPLLLQQQLQQQQQQQQQQQLLSPIQNTLLPQLNDPNSQLLLPDNLQDIDYNRIQKLGLDDTSSHQDDEINDNEAFLQQDDHVIKQNRKKNRKSNKAITVAAPQPAYETSIVTLYVSGRRPGEFSTVLSTIISGSEDSSLHKRQIINHNVPKLGVLKSANVDYEDFYHSDGSEIQEYLLPATNEITTSQQGDSSSSKETQSLESIVGDVSLWYEKTTSIAYADKPSMLTKYVLDSSSHSQPEISKTDYFLV